MTKLDSFDAFLGEMNKSSKEKWRSAPEILIHDFYYTASLYAELSYIVVMKLVNHSYFFEEWNDYDCEFHNIDIITSACHIIIVIEVNDYSG